VTIWRLVEISQQDRPLHDLGKPELATGAVVSHRGNDPVRGAAIAVNRLLQVRSPRLLYIGLFVSIVLALIPTASLLIERAWLRYGLAALLAFAPVVFANLVFAYSFRDTRMADMAFASNVLGAVVGGAIEYVALITGYGLLMVGVAILYLLAWLLATRFRFLADRDLIREAVSTPVGASP
jgi:hypothetical protein